MFCYKCGTAIPDDSIYCLKCGTKVQSSTQEHLSQEYIKKYKLTLDRASQMYVVDVPVKFIIDSEINITLLNGETKEIFLTPGIHKIQATGSFRKKNIDIDLQKDSVLHMKWNRAWGYIELKF